MERSPRIERLQDFNTGRRAQNKPRNVHKKGGIRRRRRKPNNKRKEALRFTIAVGAANFIFIPTLLYAVHWFELSDTQSVILAVWLAFSITSVLSKWFPEQGNIFLDLIAKWVAKKVC